MDEPQDHMLAGVSQRRAEDQEGTQPEVSAFNLIAGGPSRAHLRPEHLLPNAMTCTVNRAIDVVGSGIRVDFAAFADGPGGCWEPDNLERFLRIQPHIQLWVTLKCTTQKVQIHRAAKMKKGVPSPNFLKVARKILPEATWKQLMGLAEKYLMDPAESFDVEAQGPPLLYLWDRILPLGIGVRILPYGTVMDVNNPNQGRTSFTTINVLQRMLEFKPERIRILSADMAGPWIEGKTEEECFQYERDKVKAKNGELPLDRWRHERAAMEAAIKSAKERIPGLEVEFCTPEPHLLACVDLAGTVAAQ